MNKRAIKLLARLGGLDAETVEKLITEEDGGPGSGNFGHKGRPGQVGGSGPGGGSGTGGGSPNSVESYSEYRKNLAKEPGRGGPMEYTKGKTPELLKKAESPEGLGIGELFSGAPSPTRGVERARNAISNALKGMKADNDQAKSLKRDLEWVAEAPDNKEFLRRSRDVKEIWDKVVKNGPADFPYREYGEFTKAAEMSENMGKSGNYGHGGLPGGGSSRSGTGGFVYGNAGTAKNGTVYSGKDFGLASRGLRTIKRVKANDGQMKWSGPGKTWEAKGEKSEVLPNGSGTTRINEQDVALGIHTVNKYLNPDGTLTPERAALHEKIIQDMFKGRKPKAPGEPKTLYFLGGGSASGKGNFTRPGMAGNYGMPDKNAVAVVDADELKGKLPEYDINSDTGTTDRGKAASFAHEESSALAKRAIEAAYANGYDVTLDGTGDSGSKKVIKKIEDARRNGYRVEGRYCTASIETALARNIERAKKEKRLVQEDAVINIHKDVSRIFEEIAPHFDHIELWDQDGPKPKLIATCELGQKVNVKDRKLYKKFLDKANWERPKA